MIYLRRVHGTYHYRPNALPPTVPIGAIPAFESRKFYLLYRKSWSLEMMVTLDFTSEVKVWLFCAWAMKQISNNTSKRPQMPNFSTVSCWSDLSRRGMVNGWMEQRWAAYAMAPQRAGTTCYLMHNYVLFLVFQNKYLTYLASIETI